MLARFYTFDDAGMALSSASLFSTLWVFFDELVPTAVLFANTLIRDLFLIMRFF